MLEVFRFHYSEQAKVILPWSGGLHSTFLLNLVLHFRSQLHNPFPLEVVHINLEHFLQANLLQDYRLWLTAYKHIISNVLELPKPSSNQSSPLQQTVLNCLLDHSNTNTNHAVLALSFTPLSSSVYTALSLMSGSPRSATIFPVQRKQISPNTTIVNPLAVFEQSEVEFLLNNSSFKSPVLGFSDNLTIDRSTALLVPFYKSLEERGGHYLKSSSKVMSNVTVET
ncbi:hypothetical protein GEMRC1_003506 [Eukaryota sp. GEM-RC1]